MSHRPATRARGPGPGFTLRNATLVESHRLSAAPLAVVDGRFVDAPVPDAIDVDLSGHLIFPALINAHDHLQLNCFPTLVDDRRYANSYGWMDDAQTALASPAFVAARQIPSVLRLWQGALKNVLAGATTVVHHDDLDGVWALTGFPVRVPRNATWCHSLGLGSDDTARSPLRHGPDVVASHRATARDGRWFVHLAEGRDALAEQELDELDALGCLADVTVAVHGVGLTPTQVERLIAAGAWVVWCPSSNLAMLGCTLEPRRLAEAGRLALGTDARITGARDLLDELRVAARHSNLAPRDLLRLVTSDASAVLGLPDVGRLAPGACADVVVAQNEGRDPYARLLELRRADLRAVVRDGRPLVGDPDLAGWFQAAHVETVRIELDGRVKLCARHLLGPDGAAALEPGLRAGLIPALSPPVGRGNRDEIWLEPSEAYERWAPSYPPIAHTALMRVEERAMLSRLPFDLSGRRILDAGCGTGRYTRHALARGATGVAGVDLTRAMLVQGPANPVTTGRPRAWRVQGLAERLPFRDGTFDVVVCALAVGHMRDLAQALGELGRVTRRGGQLLVSDMHPIGDRLGWRRTFDADGCRYVVRHVTHHLDDWRDACRRRGLEVVAILEPGLLPDDVPADAHLDAASLAAPAAIVLDARRV